MVSPDAVLEFWFDELEPKQWWQVSDAFDRLLAERFGALLERASRCELFGWRVAPHGRLAEILVRDQFSRNLHRGSPRAFTQDPLALALAQEAVAIGADQSLTAQQRVFLYMPYMHSESSLIHEEAERLFRANGIEDNLDFELRHKVIIDRFGRYPHRNEILGRVSTAAEIEFLRQPGSRF
jgi:uncharacterized protein (DUF924 family)